MTTKFRVSPVMTTSIPLHKYDARSCIIFMQRPGEMRLGERKLSESTSYIPPEDRQARL